MARILVIDDDQSICELICEIIESEGHTTQYCQDALTALDLYAREQPDLIVCDFSMPGMDGAELFIEVNGYQKSCPFIFISGYTEKINPDQKAGTQGGAAPGDQQGTQPGVVRRAARSG